MYPWLSGLDGGLVLGRDGGLAYGWRACIQHLVLRLLLWRMGCPPLNYVRFLDAATDRLLRRVGGGYIFIHRLLPEYFAELDVPASDSADAPGWHAQVDSDGGPAP